MFIAFEGPDKTGKSTSAANLSYNGKALYNSTKEMHRGFQHEIWTRDPNLPVTYDRIDWLTHMVYRLALPDHEWNDERPRTVFSMPDTHLVFKLHRSDLAIHIDDELYKTGTLATVNDMYQRMARMFINLNEERDFSLFKTVSIVEVSNDPELGFSQRLVFFSSPVSRLEQRHYDTTDKDLIELLRHEDQQRI